MDCGKDLSDILLIKYTNETEIKEEILFIENVTDKTGKKGNKEEHFEESTQKDKVIAENLLAIISDLDDGSNVIEGTIDPNCMGKVLSKDNVKAKTDMQIRSEIMNDKKTSDDDENKINDSAISDKKTSADDVLKCDDCNKCFKNLFYLTQHTVKHTGIKAFQCEVGAKTFAYKQDLPRHMRSHTDNPKPYVCSECGQSFTQSTKLKRHENKHLGTRTEGSEISCDQCESTFSTKRRFKLHIKKCEGTQKITVKYCRKCDKSFVKLSAFKRHMASHEKLKNFICTECGKAYADKRNLTMHIGKEHPMSTK